ncbi:MFS transporter [Arthrobacter sp. ISL-48]|uniref:MFS transporter n=1 Tax=Arthrobacter sp. ISL-48 TaxID=2819110 RepID=UPI001BE8B679|nr:MFS transporter [Arthrobacter sp. ISL-48]MBT2534157.1 MFS transporter [Arthrobacter sp. ISL-48]
MAFASYASFAAFGVFWGTWGASIPRIRSQAGISDGQLGTALLFIGAGAVPAMLLTGRIIDRFGARITAAVTLILLGASGLFVALAATGFASLCFGLLLVGAASGAADVAINSAAGSAEKLASTPVITRSHGVFSAFVVVSSLVVGLLTALGTGTTFSFVLVVAASMIVSGYLLHASSAEVPSDQQRIRAETGELRHRRADPASGVPGLAVLLVGILGAVAFASENAHQSWAAVFFEDELGTGAVLGSTAPAVFAAVVAITRFSTGGLQPAYATRALILGAAAASAGAAMLSAAPDLIVALIGLAVAAAGTAVLYPTLLGIVSRSTEEATRGRTTSLLTTISYLGFLLGPVYVGLWSEAAGLRAAMAAIAALCAVLLALTPVILRIRRKLTDPTSPPHIANTAHHPKQDDDAREHDLAE